MARGVEVSEGVCVPGVLATSDMAAGEADAQLVPWRAQRETFFAANAARRQLARVAEVFTEVDHAWHSHVTAARSKGRTPR